MTKYTILDLDNCIAADAWRVKYVAWQHTHPAKRYAVYHSLCGFDKLCNRNIIDPTGHNIILTGRPASLRAVTEEWLERNGVGWTHLVMRNDSDHRPSVVLKRQMVAWLPEHYDIPLSRVVAAYDDREDIVAMYAEHGLNARLCSIQQTVSAYDNPGEL